MDLTRSLWVKYFYALSGINKFTLTASSEASGYDYDNMITDNRKTRWRSYHETSPIITLTNNYSGVGKYVYILYFNNLYCTYKDYTISIRVNGAPNPWTLFTDFSNGKKQAVCIWTSPALISTGNTLEIRFNMSLSSDYVEVGTLRIAGGVEQTDIISNSAPCTDLEQDGEFKFIYPPQEMIGGGINTEEENTYLKRHTFNYYGLPHNEYDKWGRYMWGAGDLKIPMLIIPDISTNMRASHSAMFGKILTLKEKERSLILLYNGTVVFKEM